MTEQERPLLLILVCLAICVVTLITGTAIAIFFVLHYLCR